MRPSERFILGGIYTTAFAGAAIVLAGLLCGLVTTR